MELNSNGDWKTLQFLKSKHQIFVASLANYKPAARSKFRQSKGIPNEVRPLLYLSGKDWDDASAALKEASERQAMMHLFACFERIVRMDGKIRSNDATSSFESIHRWLDCWIKSAVAAKHQPSAKALRQLKQLFKDQRNSLIHNDLSIVSPLSRVARQLHSSLLVIRQLAPDFPLER